MFGIPATKPILFTKGMLPLMHQLSKVVISLGLTLAFATPAASEPDFNGVWMIKGRVAEHDLALTAAGKRIQDEYDLLEDDPSLFCVPASLSRVWANPNVGIGIEQGQDSILISYEFYDLRREIPLGDVSVMQNSPSTKNLHGAYFSEMGSSVARYEGDRLVIETRNHGPGYIRTSRGIPQSTKSVATEVFWLDGDTLKMTLTYVDETIFETPFIMDHEFRRLEDTEVSVYDCVDANYDWFEELNAPQKAEPE